VAAQGRAFEAKMSDEIDDTRARSWIAKAVQAYTKVSSGSTLGLHDYIATARRRRLFDSIAFEEQIDRVNEAIGEWEKWALRQPGPRVVSLNEAAGEVELR
jgi:hypothetical protein